MDVGYHAGGHASQRATKQNEARLLAALGEHGVWTEVAQLSRDPEREQRIEKRSIDDPRTHRTD